VAKSKRGKVAHRISTVFVESDDPSYSSTEDKGSEYYASQEKGRRQSNIKSREYDDEKRDKLDKKWK
jgi:hypothetical protein